MFVVVMYARQCCTATWPELPCKQLADKTDYRSGKLKKGCWFWTSAMDSGRSVKWPNYDQTLSNSMAEGAFWMHLRMHSAGVSVHHTSNSEDGGEVCPELLWVCAYRNHFFFQYLSMFVVRTAVIRRRMTAVPHGIRTMVYQVRFVLSNCPNHPLHEQLWSFFHSYSAPSSLAIGIWEIPTDNLHLMGWQGLKDFIWYWLHWSLAIT